MNYTFEPDERAGIIAEPAAQYGNAYADIDSQEVSGIVMDAIDIGLDQMLQGKGIPADKVFAELDRDMGWT